MTAPTPARSLARVAKICLALPETERQDQGDHAVFRVRGKVFAYFLANHHGDGIVSVCCRTPSGENADLARSQPGRFYLPAYIGPRGWVGLRLDVAAIDWDDVEALIADSFRLAAPKRLGARVRF